MRIHYAASALVGVVVVLVAVVSSAACAPSVQFDVPVHGDTTAPAGTIVDQLLDNFGFGSFASMDLSQTQQFKDNDTRKDQVESTKLTKLTLSVTSPSGGNFDWLQKITFTASADGVGDAEVAKKSVPKGVSTFDVDNDNTELAAFVKASTMSITTAVTAQHPPEDTTVHFDASFHVVASIVGK